MILTTNRELQRQKKGQEKWSSTRLCWELSEDSIWTCLKTKINKIVKRRYTNVSSDEFVAALQEIVSNKVLEEIRPDLSTKNSKYWYDLTNIEQNTDISLDLARFLYRFIGLKSKDNIKYSESIEFKGELAQSSLYSYSNTKLIKLWRIMEFKVLYQYAYYFHLNSIFENENWLSDNSEEYLRSFNKINNIILKDS